MKKFLIGDTLYQAVDLEHLCRIVETELAPFHPNLKASTTTTITMELRENMVPYSSIKVLEIKDGAQ